MEGRTCRELKGDLLRQAITPRETAGSCHCSGDFTASIWTTALGVLVTVTHEDRL